MTWMTKDLTVKLLKIAITGLVNAHDTIKNETPNTQPQAATPEPAAPQAEDIPDPAPAPTMPAGRLYPQIRSGRSSS